MPDPAVLLSVVWEPDDGPRPVVDSCCCKEERDDVAKSRDL